MRKALRLYETQLVAIFIVSLIAYLAIAYFFHAPRGYYGTIEAPRFADPWIARGETILSGGLLYRDVFTTTPPLTNLLLLPPVMFSALFGHVNPWATLSFMVYFSLFNLFAAFVLLRMADKRSEGFYAAVIFLLNPLTFGNTVLRRQDESVVVFFIGLALLFFLKRRHLTASVSIGLAMLVKLTGAVVLPIAVLHSRFNWRYFVFPLLVFFLVLAPFLALAGQDAMFWDVSRGGTEHPFQFRGVSLGSLWNQYHDGASRVPLSWLSGIFIVGVGLTAVFIAWKRFGVLEDITILIAMVLILSPKLHTGYFSMLALTMAPLARKHRLTAVYFIFGVLALIADFYKWPVENFQAAFGLMIVVLLLLAVVVVRLARSDDGRVSPTFKIEPISNET